MFNLFPKDKINTISLKICERCVQLLFEKFEVLAGVHIGLFRSRQDEFQMEGIERLLKGRGYHFLYPRVTRYPGPSDCGGSAFGEMEFVEVGVSDGGQENQWRFSPYGILEPRHDIMAVDSRQMDIIFVPGLAFQKTGHRIGRGGGFYDQYMTKIQESCLRISLAFDFQLVPAFELNPWDQGVDWIITESSQYPNRISGSPLENKLSRFRKLG